MSLTLLVFGGRIPGAGGNGRPLSWLCGCGRKRGLSAALMTTMDKSSELFVSTHKAITDAAGELLDRAKAAGVVREDVTVSDLLKLINGIGLCTERMPDREEQTGRLLSIVFDGLHPR